MKYLLNAIVFFLIPMLCIGQNNLVMNPSFEEFKPPCNFMPEGIKNQISYYWSSPDANSPDYFHECNNIGLTGIPQNDFGYEFAKSGQAFAGFAPYYYWPTPASHINEFVQGTLLHPLQKDTTYCISFWTSHADSGWLYIKARNMGVWFIDYKSGYPPTVTLKDSLPFIQNKVAFVTDTFFLDNDSGWTELKTNYKAKGGETYFIIGNFTPKNQVELLSKENGTQYPDYKNTAYYYLDEVSIYRCNDTLPPPPPIPPEQYVNLPNAFSPNADGENDVFRLLGADKVSEMELRVFNRWGQEVFYTNQKETGWDGTFKGQPAPTGVYAYTLVATLTNGEVITKKGNVTLKR
ncbi:MAG: gliding motility-associated C-terminal domain-containing protein [Vicingaceae bacterium]|nr:MAG: gliding motility-associated C-terminal domain-containing protein [Vicingaceae bacterium]